MCIIGLCDLAGFLLYIVPFTPILCCGTTMDSWLLASALKSTFTRGKSPYGESSVLPASEDLMGNMRTGFLHGLFSWHGTGQSLLEEGIFLVTALAGVAKEPPFLRGRGHYVCLYCRSS